jgi:6,7-dimethyl-8-ribityllumazine synthase
VSGSGSPSDKPLDGSGLRVAVVASRWHEQVSEALLAGAERALIDASVADTVVVRVPGAFELPVMTQAVAAQGYDAVVALGVIIRGGTPHFEYVSRAASDGLARVALDAGMPVGFGLLTCDTTEQALDRCGLAGSSEDKGREAALAAVETALALRQVRGERRGEVHGGSHHGADQR